MLALSVKKLKKIYPNGVMALNEIDLEVQEGDFFALLGQNGAGKSTTIGILCSLINKTSGTVDVFGYNIDTHWEDAKACIGIVPQEINFNPFEKIINILVSQAGYYGIPAKIAEERAKLYLRKVGLYGKRNQSAMRLSGGMKRRLMVARALMNHPRLLILDEPTAGVDVELRHSLWEFLSELNQKGTTIILTTHYLEEAERLCKNVAIIDHGEIIEHANMKSLINRLDTHTLILDVETALLPSVSLDHFISRPIDELSLEVEVHHSQSLNLLFDELNQKGIIVRGIRSKTNRLEELFVRLIEENKVKK